MKIIRAGSVHIPIRSWPEKRVRMERKLLVAVDGSVYSSNIINYLGQLFAQSEEVHFHLLTIVACSNLPHAREWMEEKELMNCVSPEGRRHFQQSRDYLEAAVRKLAKNGIGGDRVTVDTRLSVRSIADDILHEARQGLYDGIILGRRGHGLIEELVIGSVSGNMIEKSHDVPVWLIEESEGDPRRILAPVDGSFSALMAIDHLAHILAGNPDVEVTLFQSSAMFAHESGNRPEKFHEQWGEQWCREHLHRQDSLFHAPRQLLVESGLASERIK